MLLRTHLAFAFLTILLFIGQVNSKIIFVVMILISTVFPDLDSKFSSWGRHLIFRPFQFFITHRGVIHSLTFATGMVILFSVFWPVGTFGFFLGYSVHLICDSFTKEGIQPFWPLEIKIKGRIKSGGAIEEIIFVIVAVLDLLLCFYGLLFF